MSVRLSVIVPLFNKSAFVRGTLDALTSQLGPDDELIIVDDQSTDGSAETAREAVASHSNARVIAMPANSGPASARNHGSRQALGTHLLFFDADDIPSAQMLEQVRLVISQHPDEALFAFRIAFEARGELAPPGTVNGDAAFLRPIHAFADDALAGKVLCTASNTCVSRQAFLAVGGFQEGLRYCEDPELWSRMSAQHETVFIDRFLATYRDVPQSLSYGLRTRTGSVNPYVDSLLILSARHGGPYLALARSMIFKNLVFARAAGESTADGIRQLGKYRRELGLRRFLTLQLLYLLPRPIVRAILERRAMRLKQASLRQSTGAPAS